MSPEGVTRADWELLKKIYPDHLKEIEEKLKKNYPVQYLIGNVEFLNCRINVDERVLIPRFETEFLVEKTINKIKKYNIKNPKILELGTGSGCIAIALKKNISCDITAVDISEESLELAKENAMQNHTTINFKKEDMLKVSYEHFDIIISNPPYVGETESVGKETTYEPQNAIFAKNEGIYFYENILKRLNQLKVYPKMIAFEIGYLQGEKIIDLTSIYLSTYHCSIEKDLSGKDRYAFIIKNE